ncbi:hypothetical protein HQ520_06000 [bacterium]|nr:hypothetical protein [bacterium]
MPDTWFNHSDRGTRPNRLLVLLGLVLFGAGFVGQVLLEGQTWLALQIFVLERLRSLLILAFIPGFVLLIGYSALRPLRRRWGPAGEPSLVLSLALGWGLLSLVVWTMGALGSMTGWNLFAPITPLVVITIGLSVCTASLRPLGREIVVRYRRFSLTLLSAVEGRSRILSLIGTIVVGMILARLVLTAMAPSFFYDVLEYHLPDVRHWLTDGSLRPIVGNAYSEMPQATEALYAFGCLLEGSLICCAPKILNLYLAISTLLVMGAILRKFEAPNKHRLAAVLLFLCHPIVFILLADAYVGMATALFTTAAAFCWLRAGRQSRPLDLPLGAIFLGFAFSCKYPVLGIAVIGWFAVLVPLAPVGALPPLKKDWSRAKRVFLSIAILFLVFVAVYFPWLLRALVYEGRFFPPLTPPLFGSSDSAGDLAIRALMAEYHRPRLPFSLDYWQDLVSNLVKPGLLLMAPVLFYLISPRSDRRRRGLAAFVLVGYLFWNTVPNPESRFLAPLLPTMVVLGLLFVHDMGRGWRWGGRLAGLLLALWIAFLFSVQTIEAHRKHFYTAGWGAMSDGEFLRNQVGLTGDFFETLNRDLDEYRKNAMVLLLYEARSAAVTTDVVVESNTVFDACPLWERLIADDATPRKVLDDLRREGYTHLAVNEVELARLVATYPAREAREDPAYLAIRSWAQGEGNPDYLQVRRFYPPFYYYADSARLDEYLNRLDRFFALVRQDHPPIWTSRYGRAEMWISRLREPQKPNDAESGEGLR